VINIHINARHSLRRATKSCQLAASSTNNLQHTDQCKKETLGVCAVEFCVARTCHSAAQTPRQK